MDYYERVLFNHRLGTIDPETGTTAYYLPLGNGYSKIYAKPFDSFWCCNGTAAEEFAKLTNTIYFHEDNCHLHEFVHRLRTGLAGKRHPAYTADFFSGRTRDDPYHFGSQAG